MCETRSSRVPCELTLWIKGWLLCREKGPSEGGLLDSHEATMREQTEEVLIAAKQGDVRGLADWDGRYLAFGMVPEQPNETKAFQLPLGLLADYFDKRPQAPPLSTPSTGAQPAFGVTHWGPIFGRPQLFNYLRWTSQDWACRSYHHRIKAEDHPDLHTYGGQPFFTGKDYLGLPTATWDPPQHDGRRPVMDEMHDQWGPLVCDYALTLDPHLRILLEDWVEIMLRYVRNVQGSIGPNRAVGRLMIDLTQMGIALGGDYAEKVRQILDEMGRAVKAKWDGRDLAGPVKPLEITQADPRGIVDPSGELVPFIMPVFEALGGIGIVAAGRFIHDPDLEVIGEYVLYTFVNECLWQDSTGKWRHPWMMYAPPNGDPLSEQAKKPGAWQWKMEGSNYWEQSLGAVILLRDMGASTARCQQIIDQVTGGNRPQNWFASHHWATGRRQSQP